jgi:hypothetical protein
MKYGYLNWVKIISIPKQGHTQPLFPLCPFFSIWTFRWLRSDFTFFAKHQAVYIDMWIQKWSTSSVNIIVWSNTTTNVINCFWRKSALKNISPVPTSAIEDWTKAFPPQMKHEVILCMQEVLYCWSLKKKCYTAGLLFLGMLVCYCTKAFCPTQPKCCLLFTMW